MHRRAIALTFIFVLMVFSTASFAQYQLTNLVSNQVGQAKHIDPELVNGWGLARSATSPFWVSDQGSGWSTLYNAAGLKQGLEVEIPSASGSGTGSPTGIVWNGSPDFQVNGKSSIFIFATLDGTISAWAPGVDANNSTIVVPASGGASYTGLAVTSNASGNFLFATDIANNKVDMYDGTFTLVKSFTDTSLPPGFAPFGIQDINGLLYIAFADTSGAPGGFIDIYSEDGTWLKTLSKGKPLNQPWGIAAAPKNFGPLSNTLLVSNNTNSGTINAFNAITGEFVGTIKDTGGKAIHINQLWGIEFGGGAASNGRTNELFFTAGPANNLAGTFGSISPK
ncbi:MAG: TIGR03118 family protein [Terriglobales bacterium]